MARKYVRDARGRFAGTGSAGKRPAAKAAPRGKNRLTRDNSGRVTSVGGSGATARGGRLKTASGKLRAVQTAKIKSGKGAATMRKPKGLKPDAGYKAKSIHSSSNTKGILGKVAQKRETRRIMQAGAKSMGISEGSGRKLLAAKAPANVLGRKFGKISKTPKVTMADSARVTKMIGRMGQKKGAGPVKAPLRRSGKMLKVDYDSVPTNLQRGRRGMVSLGPAAKIHRNTYLGERRAEKLSRIIERARPSEMKARRRNNALPTYSTSGKFDQSAATLNQKKTARTKALAERNPIVQLSRKRRK